MLELQKPTINGIETTAKNAPKPCDLERRSFSTNIASSTVVTGYKLESAEPTSKRPTEVAKAKSGEDELAGKAQPL